MRSEGDRKQRNRRHLRARKLSEQEVEVLRLVAQGSAAKRIAERLIINRKTVEHHLENIYNKLGVDFEDRGCSRTL